MFKQRVESYLRGLQFPSAGPMPGCSECGLGDNPSDYELAVAGDPVFHSDSCECCGSPLAGNRYPIHGLSPKHGTVHISVCADCQEYVAHGTLPEGSGTQAGDECGGWIHSQLSLRLDARHVGCVPEEHPGRHGAT